MTEGEIAWVAGIIEGEGSFIRAGKNANAVTVKVAMKDEDVIKRLQTVTQMGSVCYDKYGMWTWQVARRDESPVLIELVRPWMGVRRTAKINDVMSTFVDYGWNGDRRSYQNRADRVKT
jgi:hypothetical protein